jgi:hypothetical protein
LRTFGAISAPLQTDSKSFARFKLSTQGKYCRSEALYFTFFTRDTTIFISLKTCLQLKEFH